MHVSRWACKQATSSSYKFLRGLLVVPLSPNTSPLQSADSWATAVVAAENMIANRVAHADQSVKRLFSLLWSMEAYMYCTFQSNVACLCYILLWAASLTTGNKGAIEQRQRRGALMGNLHAFVEGNWSWVKGNRCNSFQYPQSFFLSIFFIILVFLFAKSLVEVKFPSDTELYLHTETHSALIHAVQPHSLPHRSNIKVAM